MNRRHTRKIALVLLLGSPLGLMAQTRDSLIAVSYQGMSRFRVNVDGGALWGGAFDGDASGTGIPAEGAGTRMMWYPTKAAFRAGYINGTQWDAPNIGNYSVAIGQDVRASGDNAVAFGLRSTAAQQSAFAVGEDNTASGAASVAMGYHAHTNARQGSFVFSDRASVDSMRAGNNHQATFRVSCGFRIYTASNLATGVAIGGAAVTNISPTTTCPSTQFGQTNTMIATSTGAYLGTDGVWNDVSDAKRKHNFADVAGESVLEKLKTLPIRSWSYKVDADEVRHIGPTAQDFHATFGLGRDSLTIGGVDAQGVALVGVKALEERTRAQAAEIAELKKRNAELSARLERLEALLLGAGAATRK